MADQKIPEIGEKVVVNDLMDGKIIKVTPATDVEPLSVLVKWDEYLDDSNDETFYVGTVEGDIKWVAEHNHWLEIEDDIEDEDEEWVD